MGSCENCPIVCSIKKFVPKRINRCCKIRVGWVGVAGTRAPFSFYLRRVLLFNRGASRRVVSNCNSIVFPELISFLFPGRDVSTLNVLIIESLDSRTTSGPTSACRRFLAHFRFTIFFDLAHFVRVYDMSHLPTCQRDDYYSTTTELLLNYYCRTGESFSDSRHDL